PRCTMLAMGGPAWSLTRVCHSLRKLLAVRYSVLVSEKPPVTWRVTILTPLTEGSGAMNGGTETRKSSNTLICAPALTGRYGVILYPQTPDAEPAFVKVKEIKDKTKVSRPGSLPKCVNSRKEKKGLCPTSADLQLFKHLGQGIHGQMRGVHGSVGQSAEGFQQ